MMSSAVKRDNCGKFDNPDITATGEARALVPFSALKTLWFNTGTLCNLSCKNCYIESTPRNDRLAYLSRNEVKAFLAEAHRTGSELEEIGFTGGEPFMNPHIMEMLDDCLCGGWRVLVLTNAMKPMQQKSQALLALHRRFPGKLTIRVSLDHFEREPHEQLRGRGSWAPTINGLEWLAQSGFDIAVASRNVSGAPEIAVRAGYACLFEVLALPIDASNPFQLIIFPEMDAHANVPEITEACWGILGKRPDQMMCATSRMVVKRKGATRPTVVSCTLLPYQFEFELGTTLSDAARPIKLNHPHCAKFCVLGGASCSPHPS